MKKDDSVLVYVPGKGLMKVEPEKAEKILAPVLKEIREHKEREAGYAKQGRKARRPGSRRRPEAAAEA